MNPWDYKFSSSSSSLDPPSVQRNPAIKEAPKAVISGKGIKRNHLSSNEKSESEHESDDEILSDDESEHGSSLCASETHVSLLISEYTALPDYAKIIPGAECLVKERKPKKNQKEMSQDEFVNYLERKFTSLRLMTSAEKSRVFDGSSSSEKRTPPFTQICRNLIDQSHDYQSIEEDRSLYSLMERAGPLSLTTIERHLVILNRNSSPPNYVVLNNFESIDGDTTTTTIQFFTNDILLKPFRKGYPYDFIELFKILLRCQVSLNIFK